MENAVRGLRAGRRRSVVAGCLALAALFAPASAARAVGSADPVEPGVPTYLVATAFDRGLTSGAKGEYGDQARFTDRAGQYGQALTFEKKTGSGPYDNGYVIRMNRPGNENTLCHYYGRIVLTSDENCRRNPWVVETKGDAFLLKTRWDGDYLYLAASASIDGDKQLYAKSRYVDDGRRFAEFKAVRAR